MIPSAHPPVGSARADAPGGHSPARATARPIRPACRSLRSHPAARPAPPGRSGGSGSGARARARDAGPTGLGFPRTPQRAPASPRTPQRAPANAPRTRDLAGPQIELDASEQGRMRVGVEVGIGQVRDLARMAVEFDQVGALDLTEVGPRSPRRRGAAGRGPPGPCGGRRAHWAGACRQPSGGRRRRPLRRRRPGRAGRRPGVSRWRSCRRTIGCPGGDRSGGPTSAAGGGTGRGPGGRAPACQPASSQDRVWRPTGMTPSERPQTRCRPGRSFDPLLRDQE